MTHKITFKLLESWNKDNHGGTKWGIEQLTLSFIHPFILAPRPSVPLSLWWTFILAGLLLLFLCFKCKRGNTLVFGVRCLLSCAFAEISHVLAQNISGPVGLKMPRNACMGAQRGKLAALLGIHSILAASVAMRINAATNNSFINLAPNIIYAQAT